MRVSRRIPQEAARDGLSGARGESVLQAGSEARGTADT